VLSSGEMKAFITELGD